MGAWQDRVMEERTVSSRRAFEGRLLNVRVDEVKLASGRAGRREVVEHPGAVGIVAWDGERLAMVRQWRQAVGRETLEIPAGTLEPGEDPATTAQRELAEECRLAAGSWVTGPGFWTAPGFCTEYLTLWLATELRPTDAAGPDDEAIDLEWMTVDEALAAAEDGTVADAKSLVGIHWFVRRLAARAGRPV
jgi:ADP-ribose pyrophosphatase